MLMTMKVNHQVIIQIYKTIVICQAIPLQMLIKIKLISRNKTTTITIKMIKALSTINQLISKDNNSMILMINTNQKPIKRILWNQYNLTLTKADWLLQVINIKIIKILTLMNITHTRVMRMKISHQAEGKKVGVRMIMSNLLMLGRIILKMMLKTKKAQNTLKTIHKVKMKMTKKTPNMIRNKIAQMLILMKIPIMEVNQIQVPICIINLGDIKIRRKHQNNKNLK